MERERVEIGIGHDGCMFWRFTPHEPAGTFWRIFRSLPESPEIEKKDGVVIARGGTAVRFADLLRDFGVRTLSEGEIAEVVA